MDGLTLYYDALDSKFQLEKGLLNFSVCDLFKPFQSSDDAVTGKSNGNPPQ